MIVVQWKFMITKTAYESLKNVFPIRELKKNKKNDEHFFQLKMHMILYSRKHSLHLFNVHLKIFSVFFLNARRNIALLEPENEK